MVATSTSLLVGVVIVLLFAHAGSALKCYTCYRTKTVWSKCGDPFTLTNKDYLTDCEDIRPPNVSGYSFCKKIKQIKDRSVIVTRMCDWSMNETTVCNTVPAGTEDLELSHCSACNADGCNAAPPSLLLSLPTVQLCTALLLPLAVPRA